MASHPNLTDNVVITQSGGEWHVHVTEGGQTKTVTFLVEKHAHSFAQGKRDRLMPRPPSQMLEGEAGIIATNLM